MLAQGFLILNGVLYVLLGLWCAALPDKTSSAVGFALPTPGGKSEFITVYGGLEVSMGLFFLFCAFYQPTPETDLLTVGLSYSLITYACLMLFRWGTIIALKNLSVFVYSMVTLETAMTVASAVLLWMRSGNAE
ncbi:MAG: hypothetical protein AAGC44_14865 [Planctomycetota bacterium]